MNLYKLEDYLDYYKQLFNDILSNMSLNKNIKERLGLYNTCMCSMGQEDIRTLKGCIHCKTLYNISSFKEKFDEFTFKTKNNDLLTITKYDNCNLETEVTNTYVLTKSKCFHSLLMFIIINNYSANIVNHIHSAFYCNRYMFQLKDYVVRLKDVKLVEKDEVKFLESIVGQLFTILKYLKQHNFNHGDPIIENLYVKIDENSYEILFDNLFFSSIDYNDKRVFNKNLYINSGNIDELETLNINGENVFRISNNVNYDILVHNIRHNSQSIYPCVLDFYCFIISILCSPRFKDIFYSSELLKDVYLKNMFYDSDIYILNNSTYDLNGIDYKNLTSSFSTNLTSFNLTT